MQVRAQPGPSSITLPPVLPSVGLARRFVRDVLPGPEAELAVLLVSELVTNVVRHARTDVTVAVRPGPPCRVEVQDGQAATDAFRALMSEGPAWPDTSSPSGRGIGIVHGLAARIGLDDASDGGKIVWFEL